MALIPISDNVMINSSRIDSIESKGDKIWIQVGTKSYTVDVSMIDFLKKVSQAEQSSGTQHWAG